MNGSKKNSELTIMFVPHDTKAGGVRQFNISASTIRFVWIFFIAILSLSVIGLANLANRVVDGVKLERLSEENKIVRQNVKGFVAKSKRLEKRLARLEELTANLNILAGLTEGPRKRIGAKGGPGKATDSLSSISLESIYSMEELGESLTQMHKVALEREVNLEEIKDILEENEAKLAATPYILPVRGRVTSGFGYRRSPFTGRREFHEGIDIATYVGAPVRATAYGKVIYVGWKGNLGRAVKIDHGYGYQTVYGHNYRIKVKKGQNVKRGDIIALVGNSGRSTGPHLHYEIRVDNKPINPWRCILR